MDCETNLQKIEDCKVLNVQEDKKELSASVMWKDDKHDYHLIYFMRRFVVCSPSFISYHNYKKSNTIETDTYVNKSGEIYNLLDFIIMKKTDYLSSLIGVLAHPRDLIKNKGFDMQGNLFRNGGLLLIDKDQNVLVHYIQKHPKEHYTIEQIFEKLYIDKTQIK
ncbi:hypothetical protein A3Q56_04120 [Intoshia linei]|uniref:Uncharacterized protein n=1 Tax=Intoshia linei TaxID=1819745 RepID=A0A177B1V6_9BILA|nr:hypothetical protein A3Q56_04120 [Intoshia linei]